MANLCHHPPLKPRPPPHLCLLKEHLDVFVVQVRSNLECQSLTAILSATTHAAKTSLLEHPSDENLRLEKLVH